MRLARLLHCFSQTAKTYASILPPHIVKILDEDNNNKSSKYHQCRFYLDQILDKSQSDAKIKANMIFSIHCQSGALQHLKPFLSEFIIDGTIQTQYQLDQIVKWLIKEIKVNKDVGKVDIKHKLSRRNEELIEFNTFLQNINTIESPDINQICKQLRDKFITIDSKLIFDKINLAFKNSTSKIQQKKENKLWDKLLQIKPRRIKEQCNSKQIYDQHIKITEGKYRFRFPPQPNGYLHIGHVKSIRINFQSAKHYNGICYLRYDDTNPDKQTHQFIEQIQNNVKWLGYTPDKITFASDYFDQLQYYAHQLIKSGNAYICDSSKQEIQLERKNKQSNVYRNRSIEQSLKIFPNLQPNQTLRLKCEPSSPNPTLRDPIMYRLKSKPHPRTGDKFKIYPLYDFTHCISDSIEHIDYSLCSLEFQIRRQLYYKYLDLLGLYKPTVWQYSRLNIQGNILSKRKIKQLIEQGIVDGWDDPRLLTIRGLRNRGYTPDMLKQFIDKVNCSRAGNQNVVQFKLLEKQMKKTLMKEAKKIMAVLQPIPAQITNFQSHNYAQSLKIEKNIFIEKSDFEKFNKQDFLILKNVGIFVIVQIKSQSLSLEMVNIQNISQYRYSNPNIPIIHWIGKDQSQTSRLVIYDRLLLEDNTINPKSKIIHQNGKIPLKLQVKQDQYIQFERIGFFKFGPDRNELRLCTRI